MAKSHKIVYTFIAFDDIELLEKKIKFLYTAEDYFIVHWNKYSSRRKMRQLQEAFKDYPNVHIYSKIKVVWGTYTILLAMLENMRLALTLAGDFEHFIALSEQCVPVKTKEYIKAHLARFKGRSFLGSCHWHSEHCSERLEINQWHLLLLTRYSFLVSVCRHFPIFCRLKIYLYTISDFFYYLIPILKHARETLGRMARAKSFQALSQSSGLKKWVLLMKYIFMFPFRFIIISLENSYFGLSMMYGKPSRLLYLCEGNIFQKSKSAGPAGCYCQDDVAFLCRQENIKLAKSMKRYFAPEEYFTQTLLYNSKTQRKNFLDENLCATDYEMKSLDDVLCYLEPGSNLREYKFSHVCFLRKVADPEIYHIVEKHLLKQSP